MSKDMSRTDWIPVSDGPTDLHSGWIKVDGDVISIEFELGGTVSFELQETFDDEGRKLMWVDKAAE